MNAENNDKTTATGGVTGKGFLPGQSGNPGGRPRSLARATRDLLGDDGEAIVRFWMDIMLDDDAKMSDRLEASKLLADRGWGKAHQAIEDNPVNDFEPLYPVERPRTRERLEALLRIALETGWAPKGWAVKEIEPKNDPDQTV